MAAKSKYDYTYPVMSFWWCLANFDYDDETGVVSRRSDGYAGCPMTKGRYLGFRTLDDNGKKVIVYSHLIAWVLLGNSLPGAGEQVDHWDRDTFNNLPGNLRLATRTQQNANRSRNRVKTRDLPKGVFNNPGRRKVFASIGIGGGRVKYLGSFDCPAVASFAYQLAAAAAFGEFATPGFVR